MCVEFRKDLSLLRRLGKTLVSVGENMQMKEYTKLYGRQIGKVSKNGQKAFCRFDGGKEVITGLDREGNIISKIVRNVAQVNKNVGSGTIHTERFRDGVRTSVSDVSLATNVRKVMTHNADGSASLKITHRPGDVWTVRTMDIPSIYAKGLEMPTVNTKTFNV